MCPVAVRSRVLLSLPIQLTDYLQIPPHATAYRPFRRAVPKCNRSEKKVRPQNKAQSRPAQRRLLNLKWLRERAAACILYYALGPSPLATTFFATTSAFLLSEVFGSTRRSNPSQASQHTRCAAKVTRALSLLRSQCYLTLLRSGKVSSQISATWGAGSGQHAQIS